MSDDQFRVMTNIPGKRTREDGPYDDVREAGRALADIKKTLIKAWKREPAMTITSWIERKDGGRWISVGSVNDYEVGK